MTTRGLAEEMNVSGTPAREALGRLVAEGALDFGSDRTVQVPLLTASQVDEIYDARILLEGLLIEAAVPKRTDAQIRRLESIHKSHVVAISGGNYRDSARLNFEFKFEIYRAAAKPIIMRLIEAYGCEQDLIFNWCTLPPVTQTSSFVFIGRRFLR